MIINSVVSGRVLDIRTTQNGKKYVVVYDGSNAVRIFETSNIPFDALQFSVGDDVKLPVSIIVDKPFFRLRAGSV